MTMTRPASPPRLMTGRVVILLAIVLTALNLRTAVTGYTAIAGVVERGIGFGPAVTGLVGTVVTACFAVCAFAAPVLSRRIGLEWAAFAAVTLTTVGIVLRALSASTLELLAATAVAFAGVGASNVLVIPIVKEHFPDRVKSVSTLYMVLLQVGQFVAPIVGVTLSETFGWRLSLGSWAVLTAAAAALWLLVARGVDRPAVGAAATSSVSKGQDQEPRPRKARPIVWGLVGLMGMTTLHTYSLVTWLPSMFASAGLGALPSASLLSLFAGVGLCAAFVVPALVGRLRNPFPIVVSCVILLLVGYLGMSTAPREGAVVWAVALGLGVSTFPLCLTLIGVRTRTSREAATLSGLVQGVGYGVGCLGPIGLGLLDQGTGSWSSSYVVLMSTLAITLVAGWLACRPVGQ